MRILDFFWPDQPFKIAFPAGKPCSFCADSFRFRNQAYLDAERDQFFKAAQGPIFLAYSGGKDSSAALIYLVKILGVKPIAVLYDNGFIPAGVKTFAHQLCSDLGVTFILTGPEDFAASRLRRSFFRAWQADFSGGKNDVCTLCSKAFSAAIYRIMESRGADSIILGNNFWTYSPHTNVPEDLPHMRATKTDKVSGRPFHRLNLPFSVGFKYEVIQEMLQQVGFHSHRFASYTTNCVLNDFQDYIRSQSGNQSDLGLEYLSLEISAQFLSKDQALDIAQKLGKNINQALMDKIANKLESTTANDLQF